MVKKVNSVTLILFLLISTIVSAAGNPMLKVYVKDVDPWEYGKTGERFVGYIPALNKRISDNPWKLYQWQGVFTFANGQKQIIDNYDVFAVKEKPGDPVFSDQNGFGLTYKSKEAVRELFDAVWSGHMNVSLKQQMHFQETFTERGTDYDKNHEYYYKLQDFYEFLRTSGIVSRMGVQFDRTQKIDGKGHAYFNVTAWPTLKVTQGEELTVSFTTAGVENGERQVDVYALPKDAFPDMSKRVKLTSIITTDAQYNNTVKIASNELSRVLGKDVDIIVDDGYGRTQIENVTLADDLNMDYVPTKLTLTEAGQLWVKFCYDGDRDIISGDYASERGMPMTARVTIGGGVTTSFDLSSMHKELPEQFTVGKEYSYMLGKIEISDDPGTYYIKADVTINNPNHPDRALESPNEAYHNNEIKGGWTIERKGAENDLIAQSITASPSALTLGQSSTVTAKVKNVGGSDMSNVLIRFVENGKKTVYETRKDMPANKPITVGGFNWTGPVGTHNLSVHVDPEKEKKDKDRSNNVATTGCSVTKNGGDAYCDTTKPEASWDVTYPLIIGYPTKTRTVSWTDSEGKRHTSTESYTDYSDPIWENRTVTYNEKLTVTAELNTKQGIPTDPENPKEEDRESRGSWEIIPWTNENGLNPNEVTRAGYGVEIKVQTKYTTNWETKVPKGLEGTAKPIGGELKGPTEVRVYIWDTNGDYVTSIGLVKTSGDDKTATWELPREHFQSKFLDIYERKFYTDVYAPDGEYTFKVVAMHAGQNDLSSCFVKKITIYGSMYDDWQTKRDTSEWY
ncbi:CARDB domain-containing protein [Paenibacillus senegalimassiliensis]|uniref:CARDB domain-containing protein n=1 Tax=Paenibacillus senegalimassiliensis TaxID=1737426 RepID=UPI00073E20BB|nr:CARDB domain-containing protein [Paenibacillus senegalimassiliensis]